ncbi:hypothetical protein ACFFX0_06240 [Citricoccus parietis]|uniref:Uncharacterized protein n=1 Tax=Citricoccus parietis TaxID=592307 RepID=A0ABV5FVW7_9MICC
MGAVAGGRQAPCAPGSLHPLHLPPRLALREGRCRRLAVDPPDDKGGRPSGEEMTAANEVTPHRVPTPFWLDCGGLWGKVEDIRGWW